MREYVQLAHVAKTPFPRDYMWSPKLDGVRALWIPTLRGAIAPIFSGTQEPLTGLFTRYGKPINAPNSFIERLPPFPLDGELLFCHSDMFLAALHVIPVGDYIDFFPLIPYGNDHMLAVERLDSSFNQTVSVVRRKVPVSKWNQVQYFVFDAPSYPSLFESGRINNNIVKNHHIIFDRLVDYIGPEICRATIFDLRMQKLYEWVCDMLDKNRDPGYIPPFFPLCQMLIESPQGIVGRRPISVWSPKRTKHLIKHKPFLDDEGVVVGYTDGEGKYDGMLGSYLISWLSPTGDRREFKLSGMDDEERDNPRKIGSVLTFRYRILTEDGKPREARLIRDYLPY